jgi:hypothetical protein
MNARERDREREVQEMKDLLRRLGRIEALKKPTEDDQITVRCVRLRALPRDYAGEKHEVLVKGWPYEFGTGGECELEERPGPGPALDFGFNGRLLLVTYVSFPEEEDAAVAHLK